MDTRSSSQEILSFLDLRETKKMPMNGLWEKTLIQLEQTLTPQHFSTWIKPIQFVAVENNTLFLEVPNRFVRLLDRMTVDG